MSLSQQRSTSSFNEAVEIAPDKDNENDHDQRTSNNNTSGLDTNDATTKSHPWRRSSCECHDGENHTCCDGGDIRRPPHHSWKHMKQYNESGIGMNRDNMYGAIQGGPSSWQYLRPESFGGNTAQSSPTHRRGKRASSEKISKGKEPMFSPIPVPPTDMNAQVSPFKSSFSLRSRGFNPRGPPSIAAIEPMPFGDRFGNLPDPSIFMNLLTEPYHYDYFNGLAGISNIIGAEFGPNELFKIPVDNVRRTELGENYVKAQMENTKTPFVPRANLFNHENDFEVHLALPGVKPKDISIKIGKKPNPTQLIVTGTVNPIGGIEQMKGCVSNATEGPIDFGTFLFECSLTHPGNGNKIKLDLENYKAKLADGILTVRIPKEIVEVDDMMQELELEA